VKPTLDLYPNDEDANIVDSEEELQDEEAE
jgi:hypothetical protein